jgi:hypothetical protein
VGAIHDGDDRDGRKAQEQQPQDNSDNRPHSAETLRENRTRALVRSGTEAGGGFAARDGAGQAPRRSRAAWRAQA